MIVYPNAKINLGLNITLKREDGYHEISSVFYPVRDLFDILEIIPSNEFKFSTSGNLITGEKNICIKAYELFKNDFEIGNVEIHLHKKIPIGAGLGGGSSDGAFTLKVLNKIFNLGLTVSQLESYALQLGADCPFFIDNNPKYVTGIGEKMIPINLDFSRYRFKFVFPDLHISTAKAYSEVIPKKSEINLFNLIQQPIEKWKLTIKNDFELSTFLKYPRLEKIKEKLYHDGAIYASMTGSGCVLFGVFNE